DAVVAREAAHGFAAAVHEGHGLEQPDVPSDDRRAPGFGGEALLAPQLASCFREQRVQKAESGVVPGIRILGARVAEAGDERAAGRQSAPACGASSWTVTAVMVASARRSCESCGMVTHSGSITSGR